MSCQSLIELCSRSGQTTAVIISALANRQRMEMFSSLLLNLRLFKNIQEIFKAYFSTWFSDITILTVLMYEKTLLDFLNFYSLKSCYNRQQNPLKERRAKGQLSWKESFSELFIRTFCFILGKVNVLYIIVRLSCY